jgi:hypothetical protein
MSRRRRRVPGGAAPDLTPRLPDYTQQWLAAIENRQTISDVLYHSLLVETLRLVDVEGQLLPPAILPPLHPATASTAAMDIPVSISDSSARNRHNRNAFEALFEDDDEPAIQRNNRGHGSTQTQGENESERPESIQVRYLVRRAMLGLGEAHRMKAIEVEKQRLPNQGLDAIDENLENGPTFAEQKWQQTCYHWTQAYFVLNQAIMDMDPWLAAILPNVIEDSDETLMDALDRAANNHAHGQQQEAFAGHDLKQMLMLFECLDLVKENCEKDRSEAIERMKVALQRVMSKLTPLRRDRDEVRNRVGDDFWVNNPEPKMDYAQRIIALNKEKQALTRAIEEVERLYLFQQSIGL